MVPDRTGVRVSCTDCSFEKVVYADDDERPADVLIEHGRRTGHKLTIDRMDRDD